MWSKHLLLGVTESHQVRRWVKERDKLEGVDALARVVFFQQLDEVLINSRKINVMMLCAVMFSSLQGVAPPASVRRL